MHLYLPLQTRFDILVGAGGYISQSSITRAEKYKNIRRINISLLALWSSPGSQASCWEVVERIRILLTRLVSELSLLAHTPPNCLTAPVCWDPPTSLLSRSCPDPEVRDGNPSVVPSHVQLGLEGDSGRSAHPCNSNFTSLQVFLEFPTVASVSSALLMSHGKWDIS